MAYSELISLRKRNSKTWADGSSRRLFASLAPLHYESEPDSGVFDSAIDCTPQFVNNAQFNGWRIETNGWHYALGQPAGKADGWVGFGGRGGQNWFQFRLARLGYLYVPSGTPVLASNFDAIGGAPTYARGGGNLTSGVNLMDYGTEGSQPIEAVAQWNNLWTVNGSGIYVRWRIDGGQLKEEVVIPQAAREWIVANQPPTTPVGQTYFGLVFQIDWTDIPKRIVNGIERAASDDFNDDAGGIELRDNLNRLLAFMPIDDVYVGSGRSRQSVRLRKRFWRDNDGNSYLMVGALVGAINALPAGDLVFDPTVNLTISADNNEAYEWSSDGLVYSISTRTDSSVFMGGVSGDENFGGFRFLNVTIGGGSTITSAVLKLHAAGNSNLTNVRTKQWGALVSNVGEWSDANSPRDVTKTGASVDFDPAAWTTGTRYSLPDITTVVQEIVNQGGWASGNAMGILVHPDAQAAAGYIQSTDYSSSAANSAQLDITYTSRSGGLLLLGVG